MKMKLRADWQNLAGQRYLPEYKLPRFMSCFLRVFFLGLVLMGLFIFLAGPLLIAYLSRLDLSPSVPIARLSLGEELVQEGVHLTWQAFRPDGEGYWLDFELRLAEVAAPRMISFYYLPQLAEFWALPEAGYLRLHSLEAQTLALQWVFEGANHDEVP